MKLLLTKLLSAFHVVVWRVRRWPFFNSSGGEREKKDTISLDIEYKKSYIGIGSQSNKPNKGDPQNENR